jgi:thioesterase domain-containing protein/acyl carrier protein
MVPSNITRVDALTTTENGKRALPAIIPPSSTANRAFPSDGAEKVARVFAKVLRVGSVGIHDSFFDLGGDSLAAIRVIVILESETKRELALSMLYQNPSADDFARAMGEAPAPVSPGHPRVVTLKAGRRPRPLFLMGGGRGGKPELTICAKLVSGLSPDETVYGLLAPSGARPVEELAKLHLAILKQLQPTGPYRLGGECIGGVVAYEIAQQLVGSGEVVELLLLLDSFCPTDAGLPHERAARRVSPRKLIDKSLDLLRAGATFLAELPSRDREMGPWPVDLWRRVTVSTDVKQHIEACMRYRPTPYPGSVVILASAESLRQGLAGAWQTLARGGTVVWEAPGDHDSYSRRYYRETSEVLRRCLDEQEGAGRAH